MKKIFFLWLFFLIVYLGVAWNGRKSFATTTRAYWNLQAYSWLNGHIDLILYPKDRFDLSIYNNKVYLYWPPFPTIFAIPFILIGGVNASDIYYTAFWASFGPVLLYLTLKQAAKTKIIPDISEVNTILLTLFYAFGTVYFYLSVLGTVWFSSQVLSQLPLLLSLLMLFKYKENGRNQNFILSIVLFSFSFWSRTILFLTFPIYFYILLLKDNPKKKHLFIEVIILLFINLFLFGLYNYIRFGNYFENGLKLQNVYPKWQEIISSKGISNVIYFFQNAFYLLFNPIGFIKGFPFVRPDPEGNSIFTTSPLFLLLFGVFTRKLLKRRNISLIIFLLISGLIAIPILFYYGTGWIQFGYRYALDFIPFLILGLVFVLELFPRSFVYILFVLSVFINLLGVIWYQSLVPGLGW